MNKTNKSLKFLIIVFTLLCSLMLFTSVSLQSDFAYADGINYDQIVYVADKDGGGYLIYNNGGEQMPSYDSLTVIIEDIIAECSLSTVQISLNLTDNNESIILNITSGKTLALNGYFVSTLTSGTVITLNSGNLYWSGLVLNCATQGLLVNSGAYLVMNSGKVLVNSVSACNSAVEINGEAILKGNEISYAAQSAQFGYGLLISNSTAEVNIDSSSNIGIQGHSAIAVRSGRLNIEAGEFSANMSANDNTSAGYALIVTGDGNASISGGTFTAVDGSAFYLRGNNNAFLEINGGTINGSIKIACGNDHPQLKLNDKYFVSNYYHDTCIDTVSGSFTVGTTLWSEVAVSAIPAYNTNGYRFIEWAWENTLLELSGTVSTTLTTIDLFDTGVTVRPVESNIYTVSYYDEEGIFIKSENCEYNTLYQLNFIPVVETGYTFDGWSESVNGDIDYTSFVTIQGDISLYALSSLNQPSINAIENIESVYDGSEYNLTINPSHILDTASYAFIWQKKAGEFEDIALATANTYMVKNVSDSGIYRLKIITTNGIDSVISYSNEITVNIEKGSYQNITHTVLSGTYSPTQKLTDFELSEYFVWSDATITPTCDTSSYAAIYNADSSNYNDYPINVTLVLAKADYTEISPHSSFINYDYDPLRTLSYFELEEYYYWQESDLLPSCGVSNYEAYYNTDTINYNNYTVWINIQLNKIQYPVSRKTVTVTTTYVPGITLLYVEEDSGDMPQGYSLINTTRNRTSMNTIRLYANPENYVYDNCTYDGDPINYYKLTDVTITLIVEKADYTNITHSGFTGIYSPIQTLADFELEEYYSWINPEEVPNCGKTQYSAVYCADTYNYNNYEMLISIELAKADYVIADIIPQSGLYGLYSPTQRLRDFVLSDNYIWVDADITPTVNIKEYQAIYNADKVNYNDYYINIVINLEKAVYDMSNFSLPDKTVTYNGEEHFVAYEGTLPDGVSIVKYNNNDGHIDTGVYIITVTFCQVDLDNYKTVTNSYKAYLTINKATSEIIAESRQSFVYDGTVKNYIAYVDNDEQLLIASVENSFKEKGMYEVVLSTSESCNYLAGYKVITVYINSTVTEIGDSSVKASDTTGNAGYGKIQNTSGIDSDVNVIMQFIDSASSPYNIPEDCKAILEVNLELNGVNYDYKQEEYIITVLLPQSLQHNDKLIVSYVTSNGEAIVCPSQINGNCIVFTTSAFGYFMLSEQENENSLEWWVWLLISSGIAIILAGGAILLFRFKIKILKKNGNNDIIKNEENEMPKGENEENSKES